MKALKRNEYSKIKSLIKSKQYTSKELKEITQRGNYLLFMVKKSTDFNNYKELTDRSKYHQYSQIKLKNKLHKQKIESIKIAKEDLIHKPGQILAPTVSINTQLDELELAKNAYDEAVFKFITNQVNHEIEKVRKANEDFAQQVFDLEKKVKELEEVRDAAKHSNLYTNLRRHFNLLP